MPHILLNNSKHAPERPPPSDYTRCLLIRDALKDNLNALYRTHTNQEITIAHMCTRTISPIGVEEPHKTLIVLSKRFNSAGVLQTSDVVVAFKYECVGARHGQDVEEALLLKTEKMLGERFDGAVRDDCGVGCKYKTYVLDFERR